MLDIELIKTLKILYVEDEIALRDITCSSLGSVVKEIIVASNGQEGLEKFNNNDIDLILTDIAMPIMDGLEMIEEIRKKDNKIPILVTTAFGSGHKEISNLKDIQNIAYVMKPVDVMKLVEEIDNLIKNIS